MGGGNLTRARILADYVSGGTTAAEFDYLDGVTSNVQTQLTAKAPIAGPTFTGTVGGLGTPVINLGSATGAIPAGVTGGAGLTGSTSLGTVTVGTLSHGTTLQAYVDTSNAGVIFPSGHVIQVHSFVEDISTGLTMNSATYNATYSKSTTITPKFSDTKLHVSITSQIVLNGGTNSANTIGFVAIFEGTVSTIRQDSRIGCNLPSAGSDFFIPANLNYIGDSGTAGVAQTFGICVRNYGTSYNNYIGWSTEGCTNEVSIIIKEVVA